MKKLTKFLLDLENPKKLKKFLKAPKKVAKAAGLSKKDLEALLSQDGQRIRDRLKQPYGWGNSVEYVVRRGRIIDQKIPDRKGKLVVVGTGIQPSHFTRQCQREVRIADKVFYAVADSVAEEKILSLNSNAESLSVHYDFHKYRMETYHEMVEHILGDVRTGQSVCVAFYGHPGMLAYPTHKAVREARLEGYEAKMIPGISSADCLFADLGLDPGNTGCQFVEATDLLIHRRQLDPSMLVVIWQVGVTGQLNASGKGSVGTRVLVKFLESIYGDDHNVIIYEAAQHPIMEPVVVDTTIRKLRKKHLRPISTLVILPKIIRSVDEAALKRLGLKLDRLG